MPVFKLIAILSFCSAIAVVLGVLVREIFKKNAHIWLPGYFIHSIKPKIPSGNPIHIIFAITSSRYGVIPQPNRNSGVWMPG